MDPPAAVLRARRPATRVHGSRQSLERIDPRECAPAGRGTGASGGSLRWALYSSAVWRCPREDRIRAEIGAPPTFQRNRAAAWFMLRGSPSHQRRPARMADTTLHLTDTSFDTEIGKHKEVLMVDFWAEWCHPCRAIAPTLEELAEESKGSVSLAKVNVDDNPQLAARYGVRSIPTILFMKDGKVVDQVIGAVPKSQLKKKLEALA